jgi:hypothetical protein
MLAARLITAVIATISVMSPVLMLVGILSK